MELSQNKTALLVFSLSAEMESKRKSFFNGHHKNESTTFFHLLIQQTREVAYKSGIEVFWIDEHQQRGHNFATRFANAFQKLFDAGFENVVSIGNDCPDLSHHLLQDAITQLQNKHVVLGPSKDGGVYLLGINKTVFDFTQFANLPWQTTALQGGLVSYFKSQEIRLEVLDELMDLDNSEDVHRYASFRPTSVIVRFFKAILASLRKPLPFHIEHFPSSYLNTSIGLRAPPAP